MIDKLIEEGFLLSQIQVIFNADAASGALEYDYTKDDLTVTWKPDKALGNPAMHGMKDCLSVGGIIEKIMQSDRDTLQIEEM
jgi:hypothetical protein